ncbi:Gfo/Idh/MocA family protein [Cohnella fermenti]|uniref:Gfo/Idh/MocA family oxidoreductase n=1 Tax=Cohnella fermenti TaxID=2565925 RepID=A0A4S4BQR9_9BACL|nr:Gfo/Idh/MocA family oxidoreductase [Cohnella fermenti]THF77307.1 Gfo/Idh/MocA family oxidoreductase [Cohnella fermenti]
MGGSDGVDRVIGVGVIGCGYFGAEFARIIRGLEGARVAAICGGGARDLSGLAAELGCEVESTADRLLRRADVEAVIVASPNHLHKEAVVAAALQGKHVFCEKPAALSLSDCREMVKACRENGVRLMLGHILHFLPGIRQVKAWLAAGEIGRLVAVHAARTGWEDVRPHPGWKGQRAQSGGQLFHHIHELDLLLSLMGPVERLVMLAGNVAHRGEDGFSGEDDVLLLTLRFQSGALGTLHYGTSYRRGEHWVKVNGTGGSVWIDWHKSEIELRREGAAPVRIGLNGDAQEDGERAALFRGERGGGVVFGSPEERPPSFLQAPMKREMLVFLAAVRGRPVEADIQALIDGTAALRSVAMAEAAMRSGAEGRILDMTSVSYDCDYIG